MTHISFILGITKVDLAAVWLLAGLALTIVLFPVVYQKMVIYSGKRLEPSRGDGTYVTKSALLGADANCGVHFYEQVLSTAQAKRRITPGYVFSDEEMLAESADLVRFSLGATDRSMVWTFAQWDNSVFDGLADNMRRIGATDMAGVIAQIRQIRDAFYDPSLDDLDIDHPTYHSINQKIANLAHDFDMMGGAARYFELVDDHLQQSKTVQLAKVS